MLRRRGAGIRNVSRDYIDDKFAHRLCISWIDGVVKGGMHCVSLYLRTAEGLTPANMAILEELTVALRALKGPLGGEWGLEFITRSAGGSPLA